MPVLYRHQKHGYQCPPLSDTQIDALFATNDDCDVGNRGNRKMMDSCRRRSLYALFVSAFVLVTVLMFIGFIELLAYLGGQPSLLFAWNGVATVGLGVTNGTASLTNHTDRAGSTIGANGTMVPPSLLMYESTAGAAGVLITPVADAYDDSNEYCGNIQRVDEWSPSGGTTSDNSGGRSLCLDYDGTLVESELAVNYANDRTVVPDSRRWTMLNRAAQAYIMHRHVTAYVLSTFVKRNRYSELYVFVDRCSDSQADLSRDARAIGQATLTHLARELDTRFDIRYQRSDSFDAIWIVDGLLTLYDTERGLFERRNATLLLRFVMCCEKLGVPSCALLMSQRVRCRDFVSTNDRYLAVCAAMDNCTGTRLLCPRCSGALTDTARRRIYEAAYESGGVLVDPAAYTSDALHARREQQSELEMERSAEKIARFTGTSFRPTVPLVDRRREQTRRIVVPVRDVGRDALAGPAGPHTGMYTPGKYCENIVLGR